jgi:transposase InsO family protein
MAEPNHLRLGASVSQETRSESALVGISAQPPRRHRSHGFLHRSDDHIHVLYGFFIIAHDRRSILHFSVTAHLTSNWVSQQLREAFPYVANTNYLILDHDAKYGFEVSAAIRGIGIEPLHTAVRSPWQNGVPERWVGSCRRDLLDHVIPANERHLRRLVSDYVSYYHDDRTYLGLN